MFESRSTQQSASLTCHSEPVAALDVYMWPDSPRWCILGKEEVHRRYVFSGPALERRAAESWPRSKERSGGGVFRTVIVVYLCILGGGRGQSQSRQNYMYVSKFMTGK